MVIVSLDQASHNTAYAVGINGKLTDYGVITKSEKDSEVRIYEMVKTIKELFEKIKPNVVILEGIQLQRGNVKAFTILARLQGMIIFTLMEMNVPYKIVPPVTWKSCLGINKKPAGENARDWQKKASIDKMENLYKVDLKGNDDIADAMGILTYIHHTINENKKKIKES